MGIEINDINMLRFYQKQIDEPNMLDFGDIFPTDKCTCFGQYGDGHDPLWVVVFYNFKQGHDCMLGITLNIKGMFGPSRFKMMARVVFDYVFNQSNLIRCTVHVRGSNKPSIRLAKSWGFKEEGIKRMGFSEPFEDMHILGLLKTECKWI